MLNINYKFIQKFALNQAGIALDDDKKYFVETRLYPIIKAEGYRNIDDLVIQMKLPNSGRLHDKIIDALTTNETLFFRDYHYFDGLRKSFIPHLMECRKHSKQMRVWSCACSSGQEPYSFAILLREYFPELCNWNVDITGTDLSSSILNKAKDAVYSQMEVNRGLPINLLVKYFTQTADGWELNPQVRKMVDFKRMNIIKDSITFNNIDVIFIRNVLYYFTEEQKDKVLERLHSVLSPEGILLLGGTETMPNMEKLFQKNMDGRFIYYTPR